MTQRTLNYSAGVDAVLGVPNAGGFIGKEDLPLIAKLMNVDSADSVMSYFSERGILTTEQRNNFWRFSTEAILKAKYGITFAQAAARWKISKGDKKKFYAGYMNNVLVAECGMSMPLMSGLHYMTILNEVLDVAMLNVEDSREYRHKRKQLIGILRNQIYATAAGIQLMNPTQLGKAQQTTWNALRQQMEGADDWGFLRVFLLMYAEGWSNISRLAWSGNIGLFEDACRAATRLLNEMPLSDEEVRIAQVNAEALFQTLVDELSINDILAERKQIAKTYSEKYRCLVI